MVKEINKAAITRSLGLSTDPKPTAVFPGSTFYETNTGLKWIWDGSNWVEDLSLIYAIRAAIKEGGK